MKISIIVSAAIAAALSLSSIASAATVAGIVTDANGEALGGAQIVVSAPGANDTTTTSASDGSFTLELESGTYRVTATHGGYLSAGMDRYSVGSGAICVVLNQPNLTSMDGLSPSTIDIGCQDARGAVARPARLK